MNAADALATIAQVAIALTGFTGILTVFRRQRCWTQLEVIAVKHLLAIGGAASLFALLPMPLLATTLPTSVAWQLCLPALGICLMIFAVWNQRTRVLHRLRPRWPLAYWPLQLLGFVLATLLIAAGFTPILRHPALYLVGLLWMILVGLLQFMVQVLKTFPSPGDN